MNNLKYVFFCLIFVPIALFGQNKIFSKQQVFEDLVYLQSELIDKHPNIHIYTSKEEFLGFFQNIFIKDSLTESEAYALIATSNQVIKDGHTLFYPSKKWMDTNNSTKLFLPLQPFWDGSKLYVSQNYSVTKDLPQGAEIVSVNGIKSAELIQGMLSKMMRDGENFNYPTWVLNTYFYEYYSYFYGCSNQYEIKFNTGTEEKTVILEGIPKPELFQQKDKQRESIERGISLLIDKEKSVGILTIKDWHNDILRKYYRQKFMPEIKKAIQRIEIANIQNLIIDVRDNQGGDTKNSKYLLSYLLSEPFTLVEQYNNKKNGNIVKCNGPQSGIHQPMSKTFKGNIYVLINGGSFSNTAIFCSVLRKHKRAIFVGEATGGSEYVICGSPTNIILPNTGIQVELPRLQFLIKSNEQEELHSIIPDYYVQPKIDYILTRKDKDVEFTLNLINN